jgi:hypothetical protein
MQYRVRCGVVPGKTRKRRAPLQTRRFLRDKRPAATYPNTLLQAPTYDVDAARVSDLNYTLSRIALRASLRLTPRLSMKNNCESLLWVARATRSPSRALRRTLRSTRSSLATCFSGNVFSHSRISTASAVNMLFELKNERRTESFRGFAHCRDLDDDCCCSGRHVGTLEQRPGLTVAPLTQDGLETPFVICLTARKILLDNKRHLPEFVNSKIILAADYPLAVGSWYGQVR